MNGNMLPNIRIIYRGLPEKKGTFTYRREQGDNQEKMQALRGYNFENKLDTRDEMIRVPFQALHHRGSTAKPTETSILEWLAETVENILSVAFRYILEEKLTILEGKCFAAKNIMLNIKEMCQWMKQEQRQEVDEDLIEFIDRSLFEIISEIMNKYPQTNNKGASNKLKAFIKKISNKENDQYDFLLNNDVSIKYNSNGDYSSDIMLTINKIINLPQEQATRDSYIEEFHTFCTHLFYQASKKQVPTAPDNQKTIDLSGLDQLDCVVKLNKVGSSNIRNTLDGKRTIEERNSEYQDSAKEQRTKDETSEDLAWCIISADGEVTPELLKFVEAKGHLFACNQKVPPQAKLFSAKDIRSGHFRVYHSSILRVMTKWAGELYEKIEGASEKIRHRIHKFKTNKNKLKFCQVQEKFYLFQEALNEKVKIDNYLKQLKKENRALQAIFSTEHFEGTYLKKFTNVGLFAGRLEEILSQLTFKYLNRLIHSLLKVTQEAAEKISDHYKNNEDNEVQAERRRMSVSQVSLVSLKIGDLIRGRYICLEHEFMRILSLLYKIEEISPKFLKIVKIKNRLQDNNNDILINLFFKSKILCELQLGIYRDINKKENLYTQFNHFLYELKRSEFGVLSALSNTVAQYDPIVSYFTFNMHKHPTVFRNDREPAKTSRHPDPVLLQRGQSISEVVVMPSIVEKKIQKPFICKNCKNLRIVYNSKFYYRPICFEYFCNECIQNELIKNPDGCREVIKDLFKYYVADDKLDGFIKEIGIWNPMQALKRVKDEKQLYTSFLEYGLIIEKGDKIPSVHFFKKTYNEMNNSLVVSTKVAGGQIYNFLSLNCRQQKNRYKFLDELQKFIIFEFKHVDTSTDILIRILKEGYIIGDVEQKAILELLLITDQEILQKEYLKYIERSFEKYHPTLYLNNYKFILDYLQDYVSDADPKTQKKKEYIFAIKALRIANLELESSHIKVLHPVLAHFLNLKEINLSSNYIADIKPLVQLRNLSKVNISDNRVTDISPLALLSNLVCILTAHNNIQTLQTISSITTLEILDCSYNVLKDINGIEELLGLVELNLSSNYIESISGIDRLEKLARLMVRDNEMTKIENIDSLSSLIEINFGDNNLRKMPAFVGQRKLERLNLEDNFISEIGKIESPYLKELDLSNNQITTIENLHKVQNLESLDLSVNRIPRIEGLESLTKLKVLNLSENCISDVSGLENNNALEQLRLTNNPISEVGNIANLKNLVKFDFNLCDLKTICELRGLKKLEILNLANNELAEIERIDELVRIEKLDLSHNKITRIEKLDSLKYLQNLSLFNNQIARIENLELLSELKWIILSKNRIQKLENLNALESLSILQLENNRIAHIENLEHLHELSELWLSSNRIAHIANLDRLPKLKKLGLAHNLIATIDGLASLSGLEFLDLQANQIKKIENLQKLVDLKWLVLSLNLITKIQGLSGLRHLETLILQHNQIERIENLDKLRSLGALMLGYNKISRMEGLGNLQDLQKLYLEGNAIRCVEKIKNLHHLSELNLSFNQIDHVEQMDALPRLKVLNLSNNRISNIGEFQGLKFLKRLDLSQNCISSIDDCTSLLFINEINLNKNPIRDIPPDLEYRSNFRSSLLNLVHSIDTKSIRKQTERKRHCAYKLMTESQQAMEENALRLDKEKEELIRVFTKTLITRL